jgi:hypothetical protein
MHIVHIHGYYTADSRPKNGGKKRGMSGKLNRLTITHKQQIIQARRIVTEIYCTLVYSLFIRLMGSSRNEFISIYTLYQKEERTKNKMKKEN